MNKGPAAIRVKRVYDSPQKTDGLRILVDRLWPRGLSKEKAKIDRWAKALAPTTELRTWYKHDPAKWPEFESRYRQEQKAEPEEIRDLLRVARTGAVITLLYASKETERNNAVALKNYIEFIDTKESSPK